VEATTTARSDAVQSDAVQSDAVQSDVAQSESRSVRRRRFREAYWTAGVSAVSFGIALLLYQVWNANLHLPLGVGPDTRLVTAGVKGLGQRGWWDRNPLLGAPFGEDMRDFPASGETSQRAVLRVIGAVTHSPGLTVNLYFLGGFAVLAAVGYIVFRRLGLSMPVAAALAVAYDFLPYHFLHGVDHLTRSMYFTAPLAVLLLVRVLEPEQRFLREPRSAVRRPFFGPEGSLRARPLVALLAIAVVIGSSETVTTVFTVVLLVIVGVIAALAARRIARLAFALLLAGATAGTFVLVSLPVILHRLSSGPNPVGGKRFVFESDKYGLRLSFMMLPTPGHWVHWLGKFARATLEGNSVPSEAGQAIGTIGVIGVIAGVGMLFIRALRNESSDDVRHRRPAPPIAMALATVILVAILLGAGAATVIDSLTGFVQVRTWDRIVVVIAFAAFALTGLGCERVLRSIGARASDRRVRTAATVAIVLVLAGVGVLDGGRPPLVNGKQVTGEWVSDRAFVAAMHRVQPPDGMIFEFPVVRFPESERVEVMFDYDQFRGYLADEGHFRWSYGSVKGRIQADWQLALPPVPTEADLRALIGLGFTGLWVNRDGYADHAQSFQAELLPLLGPPTVVSPNIRLAFYDLRPFASKIKAGTDLAAEARARFGVTAPSSH
jgi:phosphoglycerol transferase